MSNRQLLAFFPTDDVRTKTYAHRRGHRENGFFQSRQTNCYLTNLQIHLSKLEDIEGYFHKSVGFDVFKNAFLSSLFSNQRGGNFITGRVTFSSMIPLRSIPFKSVAMLGLDREKFPRKEDRLGFNLIEAERRRSDRNVRDNDKYLFLESILSAEKQLYFSYIGQNPKNGTEVQPSIVLDELINYISRKTDQSYRETKSILVETHPLHAFGKQNNSSRIPLYSGAVQAYHGLQLKDEGQDLHKLAKIPLQHFLQFFQDPFKFHYNKVLGVYFDEGEDLIKESELFELDSLQNYWLKEEIIDEQFEYNSFVDRHENSGYLPLINMAFLTVYTNIKKVEDLKNRRMSLIRQEEKRTVFLDLKMNDIALSGQLDAVYGNKWIMTHTGGSIGLEKRKIRLTLLGLFLEVLGLDIELYLLTNEDETHFNLGKVGAERAKKVLQSLLEIYQSGLKDIVCFSPLVMQPKLVSKPIDVLFDRIKKEGEINSFKTWNNPYIDAEEKQGYFKVELDKKMETLERIKDLLKVYE
jgi:exodeoxyribonuclease V gamma subunit